MKKKKFNSWISLAIILLLFTSSFSFSQEKSLEKLTNDSEVIVMGNVKDITCKLENGNNIWTYVTIKCTEYLKSNGNEPELTIRIPGGEVGELGQYVSGAPKYKKNELVLNFLGRDSMGRYYVNSWKKGKYTYQNGYWFQNNSIQSEDFIDKIKSTLNSK